MDARRAVLLALLACASAQAGGEFPALVSAPAGGVATLRAFPFDPAYTYSWDRAGRPIDESDGRARVLADGSLRLVALRPADAGAYGCRAEDERAEASRNITLQVTEAVNLAANIDGEPDANMTGELGRPLSIRCLAYGYPEPRVVWKRRLLGHMLFVFGPKYNVSGNELIINNLDLETIGEYSCLAVNRNSWANWTVFIRKSNSSASDSGQATPRPEPTQPTGTDAELPKVPERERCALRAEPGDCDNYQPKWYFDAASQRCLQFYYGGCGGNENNFNSEEECTRGCAGTPPTTTTPRPTGIEPSRQAGGEFAALVSAPAGGVETLRAFPFDPAYTYSWDRAGRPIDESDGRARVLADGSLRLVALRPADAGAYRCRAEDERVEVGRNITLQVTEPVNLAANIDGEPDANMTGELGRPLSIRCLAYGYPEPMVVWKRRLLGHMLFVFGPKYNVSGNELIINNLDLETLGEYSCLAANRNSRANWTVSIRKSNSSASDSGQATPRPEPTQPTDTDAELPKIPERERCALQPEPGDCNKYQLKWYFDTASQRCLQFYYGGCGGNENNFNSEEECTRGCAGTPPTTTTPRPTGLEPSRQELHIQPECTDNHYFANCQMIVFSKFCDHKYYSKFCCKSCVEAGQLDPPQLQLQASPA